MAVIVVGISHRGAAVDVRERIAFSSVDARRTVEELGGVAGIREGILLSTCNRTEFYLVEGETDAAPAVWKLLSDRLGADAAGYGYVLRDRDAVTRLFVVSAWLDPRGLGAGPVYARRPRR